MSHQRKKVLIVGAGGFVGSFLAEEGVNRGYDVWAGIRETTSRRYLTQNGLNFAVLDFSSPGSLERTLSENAPEGGWDYIVYNLGITKALRFTDFNRVNHDLLRDFISALDNTGLRPEKFLYMSSLSAMGPGEKGSYVPFTEDMPAIPNTRYGASKLKAETLIQAAGMPYIIFRPTGVYGPRDNDYYLEYKAIAKGFDFHVGFRRQTLTFIYASDLADAVFDALEKAPVGNIYIISERRAYTQKEFRRIVLDALGKRFVIPIIVPLWGVRAVSAIMEKIGVLTGKPSTLNRDKYNILRQRNWNVDVSKATRDFGFSPKVSLKEGVTRSIKWNIDNRRL